MPKDLNLNAQRMGYLLFAFGWAYALGQLPSGGLLDRFGSKRVYGIAIIGWSICAFLTAFAGYLAASAAFTAIFILRVLSGLFQSPVFPGNGRIVASWFPTSERGRASAIFNSAQYFALPIFAPIFGWLIHASGWRSCFWFMGALGCVLAVVWYTNIYGVKEHPRISQAEIETIERGGGLVNTDSAASVKKNTLTWATVKMLLSYRMLVGVYIGQYCITTLTWFFLTWFPLYLSQARHMSVLKVGFAAAVPGLCGGFGGILGGIISDKLVAAGLLAQLLTQAAHHGGHGAFHDDHRLQLRAIAEHHVALHVDLVLRQGHRRAGLDGNLRYFAQGHGGHERRALQPLRQHGRHHHAAHHRLHRREERTPTTAHSSLSASSPSAPSSSYGADCRRDQAPRLQRPSPEGAMPDASIRRDNRHTSTMHSWSPSTWLPQR